MKNPNVPSLWKAESNNGVWGSPVEMDPVFDGLSMDTSITRSRTVYFTLKTEGSGSYDIYKSQLVDGKYIAPDESCLIFSRFQRKPKSGILRLFMSFKDSKGTWTEARDMGDEINQGNADWPYVSPDGRYFFFVSSRDNDSYFYKGYWVNAKIIKKFKHEELK